MPFADLKLPRRVNCCEIGAQSVAEHSIRTRYSSFLVDHLIIDFLKNTALRKEKSVENQANVSIFAWAITNHLETLCSALLILY